MASNGASPLLYRRYSPSFTKVRGHPEQDQGNAGRLGLKLNAQKCKLTRMGTQREDKVIIGRE